MVPWEIHGRPLFGAHETLDARLRVAVPEFGDLTFKNRRLNNLFYTLARRASPIRRFYRLPASTRSARPLLRSRSL
jgi:hypothetical protein